MIYHQLGKIPHKRHTQFRRPDGELYQEHLFGGEGFHGISSLLYHNNPPTRTFKVEKGEKVKIEQWDEEMLRHHHLRTANVAEGGDPVMGRKVLLYNNDVQIGVVRPTEPMNYFYKHGEHDELLFIHEGEGYVETMFGKLDFCYGDYIYIPRGTIYRMVFETEKNRMLTVDSTGPIDIPRRYLTEKGQFAENSPFCERDIRRPEGPVFVDKEGEFEVRIKKQGRYTSYWYEHHPFDVVGWDGYLYPWIFNIKDFEPITGRVHQPPPVHQTFAGPNYVVCSFCPRKFDYHPKSIPAPYAHSNVDSDEVLYYVEGDFMSRKGVEFASITQHPGGIPHGSHPGKYEGSIGKESTDEYAVMIDTFHPLNLTTEAKKLDDDNYPYSWFEEDEPEKVEAEE
ncbi:MAG TPA: homogentisate 1,2-dioxygenase, partial [Balneolaceae bacterium]|nr:homogentisate 1,2-dioxygenase [Balneolaceae bacterium]